MIADSILDLIGNTPMIRINKMNPNSKVDLFAKLEGWNPGGSSKDRPALRMIEQAEERGELTHDKIILEATSGNTGIGLAMVAAIKGYKLICVMSESVSDERKKVIRAYGADIILTPGKLGTDGAILKVSEMIKNEPEKYYNPNQFQNPDNYLAHAKSTAEEIWKQTNGRVTHFIAALGTSGTLMGVGTALKAKNPDIQVIEAQPALGHKIQGLKNLQEAIVPKIYDSTIIDKHIIVDTEDAYQCARDVVLKEGIFCGMSCGAAMYAGKKVTEKLEGGCVVMLFADRGEKYLSTPLF